jgi:hypothetical protein
MIHCIKPKTHVLGAFGIVSLLHESRCRTGRTDAINAQVRYTKLRQNFSQLKHSIHSIGIKTHILGYFGPLRYGMKNGAEWAKLVPLTHKFANKVVSEFFAINAPDPLH